MASYAGALQYIGTDGVTTRVAEPRASLVVLALGGLTLCTALKSAQTTPTTTPAPLCNTEDPFGIPGDGL
uniref:Uncharacterized protein n=1 Tax=Romanomermis culicivorax TaxID=13658 RepID=A0A915L698_ROMCU